MDDPKTKIAIVGWGNVGRGVYDSIKTSLDMELVGILSRDPQRVITQLGGDYSRIIKNASVPEDVLYVAYNCKPDVAILCGGSKEDLPIQGPYFANFFNTVDSFDTHERIREYFVKMNSIAKETNHVSIISAGWDPGTFSLERVLAEAIIPISSPKATYGLAEKGGLSQGHSDAVRKIKGVRDARQYTHAKQDAIDLMREGKGFCLSAGDKMWRECYVVLEKDSPEERKRVETEIKTMPHYFDKYETRVNFISQEELNKNHSRMPHDGLVVTAGETGVGNRALIEYKCQWDSNPHATGSILVACARAAKRLKSEGESGAFTMLDFPISYLSSQPHHDLLDRFM
jgi:diaminopimelate dehydrogenase